MLTGTQLIWTLVKIAVMIGFVLNAGALLTWLDRRGGGWIQDRVGPNRAVIKVFGREFRFAGLFHAAADGIKFFFKEDFMPPNADKLLFSLAPILVVVPVLALTAVIPFADTMCIPDLWRSTPNGVVWPTVARYGTCDARVAIDMAVAPLNVGILFVFALAGQGIVGAAIAGWSSDNKFSLMGALRAASQMVSYEVAMGLSLIGAMMLYGTVRLDEMVRWQGENTWGIFVQPLAFFIFFAAAVAESKRIPFDLPEAESELVSGYFTEYSGMKFGMFYLAEYMEVATSSMLITTIFLGGWQLPFIHRDGLSLSFGELTLFHTTIPHIWMMIIGVLAFFGKVVVLCFLQFFIRWTLPRFRYDQLMKLGWRGLLPLSLANVLVTGVGSLAYAHTGNDVQAGFKVAADVTQAFVAVVITGLILWALIGFARPTQRKRWIVGSAAKYASDLGGTPMSETMQP